MSENIHTLLHLLLLMRSFFSILLTFFRFFSKTMGELKSYFVALSLENFRQCWRATEVHVYFLSMVLRFELFEQLKCIQQINQDTAGCQQNNHKILPQ